MDTVLLLLNIRGLKPPLVFYFRVEKNFAGGKFRGIPFAVDIIFAGGKFRAKSKFAKIYSTRKNGVIQYMKSFRTMQSHCGLPSMTAHNIMHLLKTNSQKSHSF